MGIEIERTFTIKSEERSEVTVEGPDGAGDYFIRQIGVDRNDTILLQRDGMEDLKTVLDLVLPEGEG
jgi:hypothetical protein